MSENRETTAEGHRFRRVVMATPDTLIDRRILQEAHTLARSGKEVILVS